MKGMRIGGAMVAQEHANWILNIGIVQLLAQL
jgi:UDP-N-acetylenolpyruvoylglucosamine reductase